MSGPPPPGGYNPNAFEFRPGQGQPFVPRGQGGPGQPQEFNPYQGGYYNQYQGGYAPYGQQQQYGGYPQQHQQPPQQQQQTFGQYQAQQQQQAYRPPARNIQGFQPPSFHADANTSARQSPAPAGAPVSLSIGGAPKPAPSFSIGGGAPKAAPSLSIGGVKAAPKPAPSLSIGGGAPKSAPSLSIGKKEEKKEEAKPATPAPAPAPAAATPEPASVPPSPQVKVLASIEDPVPVEETPAPSSAPTAAPVAKPAPAPAAKTNFSKVSAKNDADAILKDQQAASADALRDLYGGENEVDTNVKQHLNIIFTGHVDAGKSTMGGQLMFLTGAVDKRTMEKYEQEAKAAGRETWYLSWALDQNKEERAKGKTIEVGRAYFESDKRRYTILDAPGHKTYVPNMIQGAAQADVALLVLSARKGEFETGFERDGQTREHAVLIKNNGISKLIVVVNKMDDPTVQWDQGRYDEVCQKITPFLKSLGFNPKTDLTFIPVSAQRGQNMKDRVDKKLAPWHEGPSLLEFLDSMPIADRDINAPFMFPITERYNELGTMVMGKIESGRVKKGDTLLLMPNRTSVEVAAIYTETADEMDVAFCGDNIRIRIRGVNDDEVQPGYVLTSPQRPVKVASAFKADLSILEARSIICSGFSCAEEVTLTALLHYYDKKTKRKSKKPPQFAKPGMLVNVLIETAQPICIERFADYKTLGRFTLRDEGRTIAIGKVLKIVEKSDDMPDVAGLAINPTA